jgi:hypothetical protein
LEMIWLYAKILFGYSEIFRKKISAKYIESFITLNV